MKHVPHVLVPGPWAEATLPLDDSHRQHLSKVLRRSAGSPVSYTDGRGMVGTGRFRGDHVERGDEHHVAHGRIVRALVAPPHDRGRARFVVEKLAELGVDRLDWLAAGRVQGRPPRSDRAEAWAVAALEQSRGAWLMSVGTDPVAVPSMSQEVVVCAADGSGTVPTDDPVVFAVGPEGGWAEGELPRAVRRLRLGPTVLRIETAAIVAASRLLDA